MSSRRSSRLSAVTSNGNSEPALIVAKASMKRKNPELETVKLSPNSKDDGPSTPKKKRVTKTMPPPVTPTPALAKLLAMPYSSGDIDGSTPPPLKDRLAVPNGTNAPLISPETHRLVSTKPLDQVSPSKKTKGTATTKNILDDALAHLSKVEPKLKPLIEKHPCNVFSAEGLAEEIDPFRSLVSGIISQQVSIFKTIFSLRRLHE